MANERFQGASINIDDIAEIGQIVPDGRYACQLTAVNTNPSNAGNEMATGIFTILGPNENEGMEIRIMFPLVITISEKNGKKYSNGIQELKAACAAAGNPLPKGFELTLEATFVARILAERLGKKRLDILVWREKDNDGKERTRTRVLGIAGATGTVALVGGAQQAPPSAAASNGAAPAAAAAPAVDPLAGLL